MLESITEDVPGAGGATDEGPPGPDKYIKPNLTEMKKTNAKSWSSQLLERIGAPVNAQTLGALNQWIGNENGFTGKGTNVKGLLNERNNPLNITDATGLTTVQHSKSLINGKESNVQTFASQWIGLQATANLLKANSNPGDQYYELLQDLRAGTSGTEIWGDVVASPWAAGNYGTKDTGKVHYNGTNVTINVTSDLAKDPEALAQAIKKALDNELTRTR
jgi:hypothetical protein